VLQVRKLFQIHVCILLIITLQSGAVTVLAKRSLAARRAILPLTPPGSTLTLSPMGVPFRHQQPNEIDAQDGRPRSDSQAFRNSIDAKIKEKLERDRARQASIGPTATPRALGRTKTEQPSTPAFSRGALASPASRIQEEALTHVLIAAFEKTFGFRIDYEGQEQC
jgi:hypothetical protein